jgi:hypothetical protein
VKPLRLGAGSRIDSHGVEKDSLPKIIFEDQNDTTQPSQSIELVDGALHVFNDPEGPNRTDLGTLPGSGGGGSTGALSAAVINAAGLQVGDGWQQFLPADVGPWTGWEIVMSPAGGTVQVDILANGTPVTTGGSKPEITTGTSATGSTTGWAASSASAGDMLRVEVTVVTGTVEHVYLYLHP